MNSLVSQASECAKNSACGLDSVDDADLRQAVSTFIETHNNEWLIEHLGHRIPREAFIEATAQVTA